jgi:hypothetical protein
VLVTGAWLALAVAEALPAGAMYYDGSQLVAFMRDYEKCTRDPKGCDFFRVGIFMGFVSGFPTQARPIIVRLRKFRFSGSAPLSPST